MKGRLTWASLWVGLSICTAQAEQYPNRVIKLIIPYPAGGVVDVTGRLLAEHLQKELNGTVVVENKPGAGGTIGATFVARAEPDGYTILLSGAATHAFAPSLFKSLPYDPIADFITITQITEGPLALCVSSDSQIKDFAGFLAYLKAKGAATNYASNGYGTYPHLAMELLKQRAGFESVHVSFRGGNEVRFTALLHHITIDLLKRCYIALKRDAAPGIDGVTWRTYGENLDEKLKDLHERIHRGSYRAARPDGHTSRRRTERSGLYVSGAWRTRSSSRPS